ncbi:hypothetical protein Tco_1091590 [Tanacetum coccineum]|uniref:Uncharacterized protein n=1 Tax=Tanacetum coccineum TaxID=301880 RepID=A0ABQ5I9D8_9ASTR
MNATMAWRCRACRDLVKDYLIPNNNTDEYTEEDDVDENIDWVDTDEEEGKNDDDDDKSIDLENTDDEETGDEFVHSNEYVNDDVDEEMNDADVAETKKGDEEIIDTAKENAEKTKEVKDDNKKAELPPTSSSLSVSLGFGNQFLNLSSNKSTFGNLKDTIDAEINSLLDIKIQFEVPHIQPPSILTVPVSMITEPSVLPPILETITTAPHVTSSITHVLQQQSTPVPTPPITSETLTFIIALKQVDHSSKILATIRSHVPAMVNKYLGSSLGDTIHKVLQKHTADLIRQQSQKKSIDLEQEPTKSTLDIFKVKKEQTDKQKVTKYAIKSIDKAALNDKPSVYALMEALIADEEAMDKGVADSLKQQKRPYESSKKTSTTKETSRGKAPTKGPKANKSITTEESVKEPITKVVMDDAVNTTSKDVPLRPFTPDPEWNTVQVVDDAPEKPWFNNLLSAEKDPLTFDALMATPIDFSKFAMNQLKIDKLTKAHLVGPVYKLLKGRLTVAAEYFFNNDLEFLKSLDPEKKYTTSITKTKAARYKILGIKDMVPMIWSATKVGYQKKLNLTKPQNTFPRIEFKELYTLLFDPPAVIYEDLNKQKRVMQADELYKFSDGTLKTVCDELHHRLLNFQLRYNDDIPRRKWSVVDKRRSMVDLINKQMLEMRIIRNLE